MSTTQGTRATILLVEDDLTTATMLRDRLSSKAYCVWHAQNGAEAEAMADEVRPDLIIVDLMLPDVHGLVLSANLKEKWAAPIIICSATKRKDDPVLGFKLGAEDFVAKPFSVDELEARVEAALRRATLGVPAAQGTPQESEQRIGQLVIDRARCRVTLGEQVIRLTPTEYRLLCALANRPDVVLSREELAERVWGYHDPGVGRSLDVHMRRLRAKLDAGAAPPPALVTVRGFGYRLDRQVRHQAAVSVET
jgi:DNA-binding response OmpR family regulator